MATASLTFTPTADSQQSMITLPSVFTESLIQVQRKQMEVLMAWQKSLGAITQELWDEWVCRFGGGAPIDV